MNQPVEASQGEAGYAAQGNRFFAPFGFGYPFYGRTVYPNMPHQQVMPYSVSPYSTTK
ncbi:hypothetical protein [Paenibacillus thermotolerans]|uniref:hypothetical protein n=1 Tax=Paenibacillus thermotolerans TaxID=3027807 RepID=UPI0023685877|nr:MULTISPECIES: hypothetical protein [unclassified Paenibacillus]